MAITNLNEKAALLQKFEAKDFCQASICTNSFTVDKADNVKKSWGGNVSRMFKKASVTEDYCVNYLPWSCQAQNFILILVLTPYTNFLITKNHLINLSEFMTKK